MTMEYKAAVTEFKASGDRGEYEGHFAVFNNLDDGGDVSHQGMFAKTLEERAHRIKVFYAHDWMKLIGPPPDVLKEDTFGLFAKGRLTLDSFWGRETWALMKDNALTEGSFGFETVKADFDGNNIRHLREVRLFEISPVPLGMNPLTDLRAVKALMRGKPLEKDAALDEYLEHLEHIGREFKSGRVLSATNLEKARSALASLQGALESLQGLLAAAEPEPDKAHSALQLQRRLRAAQNALSLIKA